jgi:predicted Rossmann-fold nucleotide-binding protein
MIKRICVYCASSNQVDLKYFEATRHLAILLANEGITVVYGGGATGLMGELATSALTAGGHVIGIMPGNL